MRQFGEVVAVHGDMAKVKVVQHSACSGCHQKCGMAHEMKEISVDARNLIAAEVGDKVLLELHHRQVLNAALMVYILPLLFLFIGVGIGTYYLDTELQALVVGLLGLGGSFLALKYVVEPRLRRGQRFSLAIVSFSDKLVCKESRNTHGR